MPLLNGPRLLAALLLALYLGFLAWYDGAGPPLGPAEIEQYLTRIQERARAAGLKPDPKLLAELRQLVAGDDGAEFYMLNLIRFHAQARYPTGAPWGGSGLDADSRYNRAIVPVLLRHGGHPVFLGASQGRFIDEAGDPHWQRVAIVRYRSRRDLLEMVLDLAAAPIAVHKWAAIEKTQVFPTRSLFNLFLVRSGVGVLLILLGLGLHGLLRGRAFYRPRPA